MAQVTLEPADPAGNLTVAAAGVALLPGLLSAAFGWTALAPGSHLFELYMPLWPALGAITLLGGFLSRSRTARTLSLLAVASGAATLLAGSLGLASDLLQLGRWAYRASSTAILGLWLVRSLRRWLPNDAA